MKICVLATAAREGGALSIVNQFLVALEGNVGNDRYYVFTDPTITLRPIEGVEYIPCDTHGINRVRFDAFGFRRLVDERGINPDVILSFQNTAVSYTCPKQIVYFHQLFAVLDSRWSLFKSEERKFFLYSTLYPKYVKHYLRHATDVVVQADFIKELFSRKFNFNSDHIHVIRPNCNIKELSETAPYPFKEAKYNLFYPVRAFFYKRFDVLAEAMALLKRQDIKVHLTFRAEELPSLQKRIHELHVENNFVFHGSLPFETVQSMYLASTALVFPSDVETQGLPLVEAATMGLPIIVNDLPYAHDAIRGYEGATYIANNDASLWAKAIGSLCSEANSNTHFPPLQLDTTNSWPLLLKLIRE